MGNLLVYRFLILACYFSGSSALTFIIVLLSYLAQVLPEGSDASLRVKNIA